MCLRVDIFKTINNMATEKKLRQFQGRKCACYLVDENVGNALELRAEQPFVKSAARHSPVPSNLSDIYPPDLLHLYFSSALAFGLLFLEYLFYL